MALFFPKKTDMRKNYFLMLFAFWSVLTNAQTITIGAGTTASYFYGPYYRRTATSTFNYSKYAYIYTPDELTAIQVFLHFGQSK